MERQGNNASLRSKAGDGCMDKVRVTQVKYQGKTPDH